MNTSIKFPVEKLKHLLSLDSSHQESLLQRSASLKEIILADRNAVEAKLNSITVSEKFDMFSISRQNGIVALQGAPSSQSTRASLPKSSAIFVSPISFHSPQPARPTYHVQEERDKNNRTRRSRCWFC